MIERNRPYTPWYQPDYAQSDIPARILCGEFGRRHRMRIWQGIPAMEIARDGTEYAAWYSGGQTEGQDNFVLLARRRPGGEWQIPWRIAECVEGIRAFDSALWIDPVGRLHWFWTQASMLFDAREGVWEVVCENPEAESAEFSAPRRLCDGLMLNKPTVLADGRWLYTVARTAPRMFRVLGMENASRKTRVQVWQSIDGGTTVEFLGETATENTDFGEHMLYERRDGGLVMLVRARPELLKSVSADGGRTWTEPAPSGIPSPCSRFFLRRLASGMLLMVNHETADPVRSRLCAKLSSDDGQTWSQPLMLDARRGVSYPDGKQTEDGRIHVIYDHDRYDAMEILTACFTEEEILAGSVSMTGSFLAEMVDRS